MTATTPPMTLLIYLKVLTECIILWNGGNSQLFFSGEIRSSFSSSPASSIFGGGEEKLILDIQTAESRCSVCRSVERQLNFDSHYDVLAGNLRRLKWRWRWCWFSSSSSPMLANFHSHLISRHLVLINSGMGDADENLHYRRELNEQAAAVTEIATTTTDQQQQQQQQHQPLAH